MFRLEKTDEETMVICQIDHYFAACDVEVLDQRKGCQGLPEHMTFFFEVDSDDYKEAEKCCKSYAAKMGFYICKVNKVDIAIVPVDAGKFYVHGKSLEK